MTKTELFWQDIGGALMLIGGSGTLIADRYNGILCLLFLGMVIIGSPIYLLAIIFSANLKDPQRMKQLEESKKMPEDGSKWFLRVAGIALVFLAIILGECSIYLLLIKPFISKFAGVGANHWRIGFGVLAGVFSVAVGWLGAKIGIHGSQESGH